MKFYRSIFRSATARYLTYAVNVASLMLLARLFSPETFGVVASVTVFYVFFQLISEAGLVPAMINLKQLTAYERDGIFSLTLIVGAVLALIFWAVGPLLADFYGIEGVIEVIPHVAVSLFFFAASVVPNAFLLRQEHYFSLAKAGILAEVFSTITVVLLMRWMTPVHALAIKYPLAAITNLLVRWFMTAGTEFGRPSPGKNIAAIKPLLSFSSYQLSFNVMNYFCRNMDTILVGKWMGATSLGIYDKAYQIMQYPLMLLTHAMTPAIQPVVSKHREQKDLITSTHTDFAFKLSLVATLIGVIIYFNSDLVVGLLLGEQWQQAIPIVQIFAISIPIQVVLSSSGSFFQALDKVRFLFLSGLLSSIVLLSAIFYGVSQHNLAILALCIVGAFFINFVQAYWILYRHVFKAELMPFALKLTPMILICAALYLHAWLRIGANF